MATSSSTVSWEALQRRAYLLWEQAGFPPDQSEHFWLIAEQELTPREPAPIATPARKPAVVSKRKTPATPLAPAAEAAPVHPTRRKPTAKSPRKSSIPPPAKQAAPVTKPPAKPRQPKTGDAS